ncbi:hypothetical protein PFISCL1PPCAC_12103, partial [Pristionchus fissidentatus]
SHHDHPVCGVIVSIYSVETRSLNDVHGVLNHTRRSEIDIPIISDDIPTICVKIENNVVFVEYVHLPTSNDCSELTVVDAIQEVGGILNRESSDASPLHRLHFQ